MPVKNKDNVVIEKVLNVEEDRLKYRVEYIRENLVQLSKKLRELIVIALVFWPGVIMTIIFIALYFAAC